MRKTAKKDYKEQTENYIEEYNLKDSIIPANILYQMRGTLPIRIYIGTIQNNELFFEEKAHCLTKRHYGYENKTTFVLLCSDGYKSKIIKDYNTFLEEYYFSGNFIPYKDVTLDDIAGYFGIKKEKRKINRKQFRFSLTNEEHEIVKEFVKRLKKQMKIRNEKVIIPNTEEL